MTCGSNTPLTPPLEDPELAFHKAKDKNVGGSSNIPKNESTFESFERTPNKKEAGYEPKKETEKLVNWKVSPQPT